MTRVKTWLSALLTASLLLTSAPCSRAHAQPDSGSAQPYTLKVNTDLVLTNVIVRDKKTGAVVTGLKASDFTILENGKPQRIQSFDFQNVNDAVALSMKPGL